jgi:hypothetical protein
VRPVRETNQGAGVHREPHAGALNQALSSRSLPFASTLVSWIKLCVACLELEQGDSRP